MRARLPVLDEAPVVGRLLSPLVLPLLAACGSAPAYVAEERPRKQASLGECTFLVPDEPGWDAQVDPAKGVAVFTRIDQPTLRASPRTTITVRRLEATEAGLVLSAAQQSERILGDEERQLVQKSEGGVRYWIRGMKKGRKEIGRYETSFLRYETGRTARAGPGQEAFRAGTSHYLHFPENYPQRHVFYSFRIELLNRDESGEATCGGPLLEPVIESFRLK